MEHLNRFTVYLESVANAIKEKTCIYVLKFENMIFQDDKFQADDIKEKGLTPYITTSINEGENFIHITYELSFMALTSCLRMSRRRLSSLHKRLQSK